MLCIQNPLTLVDKLVFVQARNNATAPVEGREAIRLLEAIVSLLQFVIFRNRPNPAPAYRVHQPSPMPVLRLSNR